MQLKDNNLDKPTDDLASDGVNLVDTNLEEQLQALLGSELLRSVDVIEASLSDKTLAKQYLNETLEDQSFFSEATRSLEELNKDPLLELEAAIESEEEFNNINEADVDALQHKLEPQLLLAVTESALGVLEDLLSKTLEAIVLEEEKDAVRAYMKVNRAIYTLGGLIDSLSVFDDQSNHFEILDEVFHILTEKRDALRGSLTSKYKFLAEDQQKAEPVVTMTEKGFEIELSLPEHMRSQGLTSSSDIVEYFTEVVEAVEKERALLQLNQYSRYYNTAMGMYSIKDRSANKGPKVYDPTGVFRGRLSFDPWGKENIANPKSVFGSADNESSIQYHFVADTEFTLEMLYSNWKIVADMSWPES